MLILKAFEKNKNLFKSVFHYVLPIIICKIIRIPVLVKSTLAEILFESLIHFTHVVEIEL